MTFSDQTVGILFIVVLVAVLLLAVLVVLMGVQLRRLRHLYSGTVGKDSRRDVFEVLRDHAAAVEQVREDLGVVHSNTEQLREAQRGAVSRVGVVRYDAFDDMGGQLSFSAALLDENGDGMVLSAINGRSETRTYAKLVRGGTSEQTLSPEEESAIAGALEERRGGARRIGRGRRKRARA